MLTPDEISSGIYPLSFAQPTVDQKLANPESGVVITLFRRADGGCAMLVDGECSIYETRPQACRQFDCRKGHHPKLVALANEKFGK